MLYYMRSSPAERDSLKEELTFTHAGLVHHPDERGAELAVGRDAVLSGFEDVTHVLFHLQRAAESCGHNLHTIHNDVTSVQYT